MLDAKQAAAHINRSPAFVRRTLRYEVPVHQHKERGPLFFHQVDLDRWLAEHTIRPGRDRPVSTRTRAGELGFLPFSRESRKVPYRYDTCTCCPRYGALVGRCKR